MEPKAENTINVIEYKSALDVSNKTIGINKLNLSEKLKLQLLNFSLILPLI